VNRLPPTWPAGASRPTLVPSGEQSAQGLLNDWPPFDDVFDPINRVFLPRADIATETLVAGLIELGWEVDDVTAYRTVRAAPPPAPVREAIKSGGFRRRWFFTSSSTVRKPGRDRGQAARQHDHRVHRPGHRGRSRGAWPAGWDVLAETPVRRWPWPTRWPRFGTARRTSAAEGRRPGAATVGEALHGPAAAVRFLGHVILPDRRAGRFVRFGRSGGLT